MLERGDRSKTCLQSVLIVQYPSYVEEQSQFHVLYTWKYNPRWTISLLLRERERRAIRAASPFTIDRNYIVPWFPHHCPSKTCWKKSRNIPTLSFKGSGKATRHEAPPLVVSRLTLVGWCACWRMAGWIAGRLASPLYCFLPRGSSA